MTIARKLIDWFVGNNNSLPPRMTIARKLIDWFVEKQ